MQAIVVAERSMTPARRTRRGCVGHISYIGVSDKSVPWTSTFLTTESMTSEHNKFDVVHQVVSNDGINDVHQVVSNVSVVQQVCRPIFSHFDVQQVRVLALQENQRRSDVTVPCTDS